MDTTRAQEKALDDELVAPENRLKIGKSNLRLRSNLKSKEPTLQVELDALKLTPFYNAFEIIADVPEIYMQEFWVTISRHHSSLCFKLKGKIQTINIDNFRDMLKIFPKLLGQEFEEPPLEEEILSFIRDLGHTGEIKFLSDRFYGYATNMETLKDVYSRHMIIAVTSLKIMEFFGYKDLEEITVRRQDDQLSRFREGDFKRLLLVQERVEDLQLAVESYQKKRNLLRPDSYRLDLRKMTRYTAYHNIQGIIYQDDMDINRLMRTDELYKFSDDTLNHVCTALNDIATGIQMEY
ncbi:hypothetical protein Tco_1488999 [Tanacetum coccineum]